MKRKLTPSYLLHRQSGKGRAVWTDVFGTRHQKLLPGPFDSQESRTAFARLQLEIETTPHRSPGTQASELSVAELLLAYVEFAKGYYRDADGNPTPEVVSILRSIKPVRDMYGHTQTAEFGPKALAAVRQQMVKSGWCRTLINKRIDRVRRVYRWAASEELVPVVVYQALRTLPGLRAGRSEAPESEPVKPVADETVKATLPHLPQQIRVMVELLWYTGMRPSEVCNMTLDQLNRDGGCVDLLPSQAQDPASWEGTDRPAWSERPCPSRGLPYGQGTRT